LSLPKTPSQTVGPYYAIGLCRDEDGHLAGLGDTGALRLHGQLFDGDRQPVSDGMVEVWDHAGRRWARSGTDHDFPDEREANAADPVLAGLADDERARLVADAEDGALRFDIHLQGDRQTVFFDH
jgi:protocatechuate 3,4-dioxygenase alpha subunit